MYTLLCDLCFGVKIMNVLVKKMLEINGGRLIVCDIIIIYLNNVYQHLAMRDVFKRADGQYFELEDRSYALFA